MKYIEPQLHEILNTLIKFNEIRRWSLNEGKLKYMIAFPFVFIMTRPKLIQLKDNCNIQIQVKGHYASTNKLDQKKLFWP